MPRFNVNYDEVWREVSSVEFEKITQADNLYGCLGIGLRYSEILEFKSKDGGFQIMTILDFYSMKK